MPGELPITVTKINYNCLDDESYAIIDQELLRFVKIFINELAGEIEFNNKLAKDIWHKNKLHRKQRELEYRLQRDGVACYAIVNINEVDYVVIPEKVFQWLEDPNEGLLGIGYFVKPYKGTFSNMWEYVQYGYWTLNGAKVLMKKTGVARDMGNNKIEIYNGVEFSKFTTELVVDKIPAILVRSLESLPIETIARVYLEVTRRMLTKKIEFIESNGTKIIVNESMFINSDLYKTFIDNLKGRDIVHGVKVGNIPVSQLLAPLSSSINATDISETINFFLKRAAELVFLPEFSSSSKAGVVQQNTPEILLSLQQKLRNLDLEAKVRELKINELMLMLGAPDTTESEIKHTTADEVKQLNGMTDKQDPNSANKNIMAGDKAPEGDK